MATLLTLFALALAFALPLLLTLWWRGNRLRYAVLLVGTILSGWTSLTCEALLHKFAHDADVYERSSAGLAVAQSEFMDDGVGDHVLALFGGWIVPSLGTGVGWAVRAVRLRAVRRRGFDVVAPRPCDSSR